jgi:hypothetical protein
VQRRLAISAILIGIAVVFVGAAVVFGLFDGQDLETDKLVVPAVGETTGDFLADGTPVFVVHALDGSIRVVEAVSTHLPDDPMGWCAATRTIEDVAHGAKWDETGSYVAGPARSDLGTFELDGRMTSPKLRWVNTFRQPAGLIQG